MKALSIKQPWASLIAHGIKDVENRTWKTSYRGRIYIHASGKPSFRNLTLNLSHERMDELAKHIHLFSLDAFNNSCYPKSAIIGEVDIVDCVVDSKSIWADQQIDPIDNIYHWVLANAVLYDEPILNVNGKLSLWEYDLVLKSTVKK